MPYDIIILGGQSNAEGNGLGETDRPFIPDERILMMRDGGKFAMARDLKSNNQTVGNGDDIHFCRDALATLGERYFDAFKKIAGIQ